jgi:hypothetical protein
MNPWSLEAKNQQTKKKKTHKSHLLLPMQICGLQPWLGFSIA